MRLHPSVVELREMVIDGDPNKIYNIDLRYITSRGKWYHISWKGDENKSGGIATNIGIHFFDMLLWIFGAVKESRVETNSKSEVSGTLTLKQAEIKWQLSVDKNDLPLELSNKGVKTFRSLKIGNKEFEFSGGFEGLHTRSYEEILDGKVYGLNEVKNSINLINKIKKVDI